MHLNFIFLIVFIILAGCSKPEDKAAALGFDSVEHMEEVKKLGFSSMNDYLTSLLPDSGCANTEELQYALQESGGDCNYLKKLRKEEEAERVQANKFIQGISYSYINDGSCKSKQDEVCLNVQDYQYLCQKSTEATKWAASLAVPVWYDREASYLIENGGLSSLDVSWDDSRQDYKCRLSITVQGIYNGSQVKKIKNSAVNNFIVNKEGEVLVHGASPIN